MEYTSWYDLGQPLFLFQGAKKIIDRENVTDKIITAYKIKIIITIIIIVVDHNYSSYYITFTEKSTQNYKIYLISLNFFE